MNKKLAFIINVFREDNFHSGGERLFYELVKRAIENGWLVDLYCTTYLGENNVLKPKINKIIHIGHPKDFKYPEKIEKFYNKAKELIKKEKYEHVFSENISPPVDIGVLQGHSLLHYKDMSGNIFSQILFGMKKYKHIKAQKKWFKTGYNKILVPANILKEELKRNFNLPDDKFLVTYPGVDKIDADILSFNKDYFTFGLSAPSFSKKGGYVFIKALSILKKKGYKFKAKIICGKAQKNIFIKALLNLYGIKNEVEILPHQSDMKKFYSSIDIIVMASSVETFGLVAIEGMMCGKPAVVGSYCGASEILDEKFVFDMQSAPAANLAKKLEYFIDNKDKYDELAQSLHELACKYSWTSFCDRIFENI